MRLGSLFSGIGGLELGLELALGCEVVWQVEREPWPRAVLARHWPDADRSVTDVCEAGAGNLAPVDVVCGGFPCQDISLAGAGRGIEHGKKSGLWREYARILRELRPRFVVVENSAALPSRGLDIVLGDMAALGYHAEWARIGAVDVGAPHRRWRCFIVAWLPDADGDRLHEPEVNEVRAGRDEPIVRPQQRGAPVADAHHLGREGVERAGSAARAAIGGGTPSRGRPTGRDPVPTSQVRRVADGLPRWMGDGPMPRAIAGSELRTDGRAALRALGNAVVPQVAFEVGLWLARIIEREGL